MVTGRVGVTELWCCTGCGATDLKGGPTVEAGAELILALTQPRTTV